MSAALRLRGVPCVLVGDGPTLERARELVADRLGARGRKPLVPFVPGARLPPVSYVQAGPPLRAKDRRFGKPSERSGAAQLVRHTVLTGFHSDHRPVVARLRLYA